MVKNIHVKDKDEFESIPCIPETHNKHNSGEAMLGSEPPVWGNPPSSGWTGVLGGVQVGLCSFTSPSSGSSGTSEDRQKSF